MEISIAVLDDECGDDLTDLITWIKADEDLRELTMVTVTRPLPAGQMSGGIPSTIEAALSSKELLVALASSLGGWLSARATTRRTRIRIRRGEHEVEIDTTDLRRANEIARRIEENLHELNSRAPS